MMGYLSQWHVIFLRIHETIQTIPADGSSIGSVERNERMRSWLIADPLMAWLWPDDGGHGSRKIHCNFTGAIN